MELVYGDGYSFGRKDINKEHLSIPFVEISRQNLLLRRIFSFSLSPLPKNF